MEPLRTVEYAVRFAASLSAWWLLLAVPVVVLLGSWLYRLQARGASLGNVWGLTVLRTLILVGVVVLAFRPSLIRRNIVTYPARLLMVLDDSASMGIPDPALPEAEALPIARGATDRLVGREAPTADQRAAILDVERTLMRYEQFSRGVDRGTDAFFREAERVQLLVNERLETVAQRATDLANAAADGAKLREVATRCRDLQPWLQPLFSGDQAPGVEFGIKMRNALTELADLLAQQRRVDRVGDDQHPIGLGREQFVGDRRVSVLLLR
jgi:cbb3-type cytochrome oxidase subunit 3